MMKNFLFFYGGVVFITYHFLCQYVYAILISTDLFKTFTLTRF